MLEIMEINVLGDVLLDFGASGEVRTIQTFSFQGAEEILPWCIITGAAGAGDRRRNEGLRQGVGCMGDLFDPPLGRCGAEVRQQPFPVSEPRGGYPLPARMTCRNRSSTRGQHCHTNPAQRIFNQTRRHFRCSNSRPPFAMAQTRAGLAFPLQRGRRKVCTSQC